MTRDRQQCEPEPAERDELMRRLVEETTLSFDAIGKRCGVAGSTVCRRAQAGGWRRPPEAAGRRRLGAGERDAAVAEAAEPSPEERRREVIAGLWRVAEAQAQALGRARAGGVSSRDLKALVDVLERLDRLQSAALPPARPERTLDEVRQEFAQRLAAIYGCPVPAFADEQSPAEAQAEPRDPQRG